MFADLLQKGSHLGLRHRTAPQAGGGREQEQAGDLWMLHSGQIQRAAALGHIGEVHQRPVREPQCQIQVPQADVAVQAEDPAAGLCQRRADSGGKGCLSGAALSGHDGNALPRRLHDGTSHATCS